MSNIIGLGGFSGSGKSTSLKYLDPSSTFIISITPKQLAIPGFRKNYKKFNIVDGKPVGNYFNSSKLPNILKIMEIVNAMPHIKVLVVDDMNYLLSMEVMDRASEKGWDKHTEMAQHYYSFLKNAMNLRDDLYVILISHIVNDGTDLDPNYKLFSTGE